MSLIEAVIAGNEQRKMQMAERITATVKDIPNAKIAVWGLAFKNGTDDCRESPAIYIVNGLIDSGAAICAYDPKAMENAQHILSDKISYAPDMYKAAEGADVLAILTEWEDFKAADLLRLKQVMRTPQIVDLRNMLSPEDAESAGFAYHRIGRK